MQTESISVDVTTTIDHGTKACMFWS